MVGQLAFAARACRWGRAYLGGMYAWQDAGVGATLSKATPEVEAELDGSLPGDDGRSYLDRHETLLLSEASTATLRVVRGDPPVGYRFRVSVSR